MAQILVLLTFLCFAILGSHLTSASIDERGIFAEDEPKRGDILKNIIISALTILYQDIT